MRGNRVKGSGLRGSGFRALVAASPQIYMGAMPEGLRVAG